MQSAPLPTFLFGTKFVLCIDRHLYVPSPGLQKVDHGKCARVRHWGSQ